jgi:hypothetical protein
VTASYRPDVTFIERDASAVRLVLRINPLDEFGEQVNEQTTTQVAVEGIIGSPEGVALGSPGDIRIRQDVPQIWQKAQGIRTTTGWVLIGPGGGGGGATLCDAVPQPLVAGSTGSAGIDGDASRCDHAHPVPVDVPVTVTGGTNAAGASASLSRADHEHRLEVLIEAAGALVGARPTINFIGATVVDNGGSDRVDVTIPAAPAAGGVPNALAVGQAGAAGVSTDYAREDHDHAVPVGTPVTVTGATNSDGVATTFPRSDHQHRLEVQVQQEGVAVGAQPILNFTGAAVSVADDGGSDRVNVAISVSDGLILQEYDFRATPTVPIVDGALTISGRPFVAVNSANAAAWELNANGLHLQQPVSSAGVFDTATQTSPYIYTRLGDVPGWQCGITLILEVFVVLYTAGDAANVERLEVGLWKLVNDPVTGVITGLQAAGFRRSSTAGNVKVVYHIQNALAGSALDTNLVGVANSFSTTIRPDGVASTAIGNYAAGVWGQFAETQQSTQVVFLNTPDTRLFFTGTFNSDATPNMDWTIERARLIRA